MENKHPLADWLADNGETGASFARKIEISEPHLSLIMARKRGASLEVAVRIEAATNGIVRAGDLLPQQEAAQ